MIRVEFHEEARQEYLDAVGHYRSERARAASDFVAEVRSTVARIVRRPLTGSPGEANTRRKYVRRFPYTIIYIVSGELVQIVAVMHQRREPGYWTNRL